MVLFVPLVGAHFRPPAKWVLEVLPAGASLRLQPEPGNPYDPNAIQVWVRPQAIPAEARAELEGILAGAGWSLEELLSLEELQLGYVGDSKGKVCLKEGWPGNAEVHALQTPGEASWNDLDATLGAMPTGHPAVRVET